MANKKKLLLIIERHKSKIWGRVQVKDNLLTDFANSLASLEKKMRKLLAEWEGIDDVQFEYAYDLTIFFERFAFLNQSKLAEIAGINPCLIRQYSSGHKQPSGEQVKKIELALHRLGEQLRSVHLSAKSLAV